MKLTPELTKSLVAAMRPDEIRALVTSAVAVMTSDERVAHVRRTIRGMAEDERAALVDPLVRGLTEHDQRELAGRLPRLTGKAPSKPGRYELWWRQKLIDGRVLPDSEDWRTEIVAGALLGNFVREMYLSQFGDEHNRAELESLLGRVCGSVEKFSRHSTHGHVIPCYRLPSLDEARQLWTAMYGDAPWAGCHE